MIEDDQGKIGIIGVDVDDVLFVMTPPFYRFHNRQFGTDIQQGDITTFDLCQVLRQPVEVVVNRVQLFYGTDEFRNLQPTAGAFEVLSRLRSKFSLIAISSRPSWLLPITEQALSGCFPGMFSRVILLDTFVNGDGVKKAEVCKEFGVTVMVDDHVGNLVDCPKEGVYPILFRQRWNLEYDDILLERLGIVAVHSWMDIEEEIARLT